jgi:hypothetical protein
MSFSAKLITKFPLERSEKEDEGDEDHRKKALKLVHERVKYIRKALMMSKGER